MIRLVSTRCGRCQRPVLSTITGTVHTACVFCGYRLRGPWKDR